MTRTLSNIDPSQINQVIAQNLQTCSENYKISGEHWRSQSYARAATKIKNFKTPITSKAQALKIHGIGEGIAEKIEEILQTGSLRKATYQNEESSVMKMFTQIFGAGVETAKK